MALSRWLVIPAILVALSAVPARADAFCGSQFVEYFVEGAVGVRCVKFVDGGSFAWYGEGSWGAIIYRHLGYAQRRDATTLTGYAADFHGSGETANGRADGTLSMTHEGAPRDWTRTPPSFIRVAGAWNETWRRGPAEGYRSPLGPVARTEACGQLVSYEVFAPSGGASAGVRCVLLAGDRPVAWYGEGAWGAARYGHVGAAAFSMWGVRWGAADLCGGRFTTCGSVPFGQLILDPPRITAEPRVFRRVTVTGAWNEFWEPIGVLAPVPPPADPVRSLPTAP